MGKFSLATRLADEIGSSVDEAMRYVDEVGAPAVRNSLDNAAQAGSETVQNWWKPATAVGGVAGGGALAWRQQDIQQAKAIASQEQEYSSAVEAIMASDMEPKAKRQALEDLNKSSPSNNQNNDNNSDDDGGLFGGDLQTTLVLLVVVAFALRYTLGEDDA